jgi:hypothetical protein
LPQALLQLVPVGATTISDRVRIIRENGEWTYFNGVHPIFGHPEADRRSFRLFTSQLICQGGCRQSDIARAFGGVLSGLPTLAQNGLFEHLHTSFRSLTGDYTTLHMVTLLAYMAMCRMKLPRRYVSRQRLSLRGTTNYWVKDIPKWEQRKSELLEIVQQQQHEHEHELKQVKEQRKQTPHHIAWDQFPDDARRKRGHLIFRRDQEV